MTTDNITSVTLDSDAATVNSSNIFSTVISTIFSITSYAPTSLVTSSPPSTTNNDNWSTKPAITSAVNIMGITTSGRPAATTMHTAAMTVASATGSDNTLIIIVACSLSAIPALIFVCCVLRALCRSVCTRLSPTVSPDNIIRERFEEIKKRGYIHYVQDQDEFDTRTGNATSSESFHLPLTTNMMSSAMEPTMSSAITNVTEAATPSASKTE